MAKDREARDRGAGPERAQQIGVAASIGALAAPLGWAADRVGGAGGVGPLPVATAAGAAAGTLGLRPQKVALGPAVGAAIGLGLARLGRARSRGRVPGAVAAAAAVVGYRTVASQSRYVGTDYVRSLAQVLGRSARPTCR